MKKTSFMVIVIVFLIILGGIKYLFSVPKHQKSYPIKQQDTFTESEKQLILESIAQKEKELEELKKKVEK